MRRGWRFYRLEKMSLKGDSLSLSTTTWNEAVAEAPQGCGSASSPRQLAVGQRETAWSCTKGNLDWILGRTSLDKWLSTGTVCPGKWWSHSPWKCYKNETWHFVIWFSEPLIKGWTQPWRSFPTLMILWFHYTTMFVHSTCKLKLMYATWYQLGHAISCRCWVAQL